eukprot:6198722-Pleurochrysis_carterae.AAC.1
MGADVGWEKHVNADRNRNDQAFKRSKTTKGRRLMLTTVLLREYPVPHPPGSWWIDADKPRTTSTNTNLPTTTSIALRRLRRRGHRRAHGVVKRMTFSECLILHYSLQFSILSGEMPTSQQLPGCGDG